LSEVREGSVAVRVGVVDVPGTAVGHEVLHLGGRVLQSRGDAIQGAGVRGGRVSRREALSHQSEHGAQALEPVNRVGFDAVSPDGLVNRGTQRLKVLPHRVILDAIGPLAHRSECPSSTCSSAAARCPK